MFAGIISGGVYQQMSDKVVMARKLVAEKGLQLSDQLSNNAYFEEVARQFQLSGQELTHLFWEKCNPSGIWVVILAMGFVQTYFSGFTINLQPGKFRPGYDVRSAVAANAFVKPAYSGRSSRPRPLAIVFQE